MCALAQMDNNCYQKTQSKSDIKKLEPVMCVPKGYYIVDIYEEDLNGDGRVDKVTEWFKEKLSNGDTTFHSIYFQDGWSSIQMKFLTDIFKIRNLLEDLKTVGNQQEKLS